MRLGIFGGSFDPVHNAHLAIARACQQQVGLDEVWFTPTAIQPLKHKGPHATDSQRVEMLRLATADELSWRVCTLEIDRGGFSYTVETLRQIHEELPEAELFFPIGGDALRDVPQWKEPREIFRLATPLVVGRAGRPVPDLNQLKPLCTAKTQPRLIEMPAMSESSTEIRRLVASGRPIDAVVPPVVAAYIAEHGLYKNSATT
jgi:nicotinate-nucleotide adenylyltransferase